MIPNMQKLMGQFAPMFNMFKQSGGMGDPMSMIRGMMNPNQFREFESLVQQGRQAGVNPEEFVKSQFQSNGLDLKEIMSYFK